MQRSKGVHKSACNGQAGLRGYGAWQLAAEMRNRYKLSKFSPKETTWDVEKTLKEVHDQELRRRNYESSH